MTKKGPRWLGAIAVLGGLLALGTAPLLVAIKYMTGWAIIPEPFWVPTVRAGLASVFPSAPATLLWTAFGTVFSVALLCMLIGFLAVGPQLRNGPRSQQLGYWLVVVGIALVLPGDAIHSWTWHQNGLTIPTPGSNPLANTAYAVHMMGMNLVMVGTLVLGVAGLRRRTLRPWLGWLLILVLPAAVLASLTFLPTTPSGALWLFSILVALSGRELARGRLEAPSGGS